MSELFDVAPASFAILALTIVISLIALKGSPALAERNLLRPQGVLREHRYDTLITNGFFHADMGHLFFNMLTLYFFGPTLEARIGTPKFVALYFLGLLVSSLGTVITHRKNASYASLGASGAILAVLFAFIVYYPTRMLGLFFVIPVPAALFAVGYLAYTVWASKYSRGRINHDAHFDGALFGMLFVAVTDYDTWRRAFATIAGALN
jgi:membrane associated rhomboid family serine protease